MHPVRVSWALEGADAALPLQLEVPAVPSVPVLAVPAVQELLHMELPPPPRMSGRCYRALYVQCRCCKQSATSTRSEIELPT